MPDLPPSDQPVDQPVVVIGNGPVGQTAALLLARWGIPTVVLDEHPRRELIGSKSICQHRDVLDVWAAVGAGRIAAEGVTWRTARTYHRDRELFNVTLPDPGRSAFPPFVNLSQSRTEEILDELIAAAPLVDVRWGHEVVAVDQDEHGVTLSCRTEEGPVRVRARYALCCAGAHTRMRELLGVEFPGHSFNDRFLICDIRADLPDRAAERRFYFDPEWNPERQVLIHPCPDSTYRIDWQVPPDFDLAAETTSGGLDRRIRQIVGERGYEIVWSSVYRFHSRKADRLRVGRVLLGGDAAHVMAPFGARGLNSGVHDAENAAWKLAFVLRGWAPDRLLSSYHDERDAAAAENLAVTGATMRFLVPQNDAEHAHRRSVLARAGTDPAVRAQVNSGRLFEPYWYDESPLTTPDPTRADRPPVRPGVLVPDLPIRPAGDRSRLRELARDGFLALTASGAGTEVGDGTVPVRAVALDRLGLAPDGGPDGRSMLGIRPGETYLVRPDGYLAAVLPAGDRSTLTAALRRASGW